MRKNKNKQAGIAVAGNNNKENEKNRKIAAAASEEEGGRRKSAAISAAVVVQGHHLHSLLSLFHTAIESAKQVDGLYSSLPPKLWFKQQFWIGMNEVTRALERMPPSSNTNTTCCSINPISLLKPNLHLQAIIVAADCNPKWMTKHLHALASTRNVPLILLKDQQPKNKNNKASPSSFQLGQLLNLKTAIAIGIKTKGNAINQIMDEFIHSKDVNLDNSLELLQQEMS